MNILIVEDELKIREILAAYCRNEGWEVFVTDNGDEALSIFRSKPIDAVLLDLMLEGVQGEEVCRQIRRISNVPLIMLTSKNQENEAVLGLDLGADHYYAKPFRVKELMAQIRAMLRRSHANSQQETPRAGVRFNRGELLLMEEMQDVLVNGRPAQLTTTEFRLLHMLVGKAGRVISRGDLSNEVLGYRFAGDGRVVDAHIKNIRKKIEPDPRNPIYIATKVGAGYRFCFQPEGERSP